MRKLENKVLSRNLTFISNTSNKKLLMINIIFGQLDF